MKRKIVIAMALVLVVAMLSTMLVGCDEIFKKNDGRDANQTVATITYQDQTSSITKAQLTSSFNSYAYYYVYYYSMTYEAAADYIVKSLAQRELLVLYAKQQIADVENLGNAAFVSGGLQSFLSNKEYVDAIDSVNKSMQTSLETNITSLIDEQEANAGTTTSTTTHEHATITKDSETVRIIFDADGGSDVTTQKIVKGEKADVPTNPTKTGYSFVGWYPVVNGVVATTAYNFEDDVNATITLKAKWDVYTTPRTAKTVSEEEETSYDYTAYASEAEIKAAVSDEEAAAKLKFFDAAYLETAKANAKEKLELTDKQVSDYFSDAMTTLKNNLSSNYLDYDYYLNSELKTLILSKYERMLGRDVTVTAADVLAQYQLIIAQNKEAYATTDSKYESALTGSLTGSVYQNYTEDGGYGFVINILLKLGDDDLAELTQMVSDGKPKEQITERRNELLSALTVKISNPDYDAEATDDDNETSTTPSYVTADPMTNVDHKCNGIDAANANTEYNKDNDTTKLLTFQKNADGEWEIVYGVHECPTMAYIHDTSVDSNVLSLPAITTGGDETGVVNQIYASFKSIDEAVDAGTLSRIEAVYWQREVATAWLYLVGDDSGAVTSTSNNGGLGYLVQAKDSSVASTYIEDFTTHARALIKEGVGSYSVDGTMSGSYIFADSFIESGSTSSAYAGIFMLMTSYVAYDKTAYTYENLDGTALSEGATEKNVGADLDAQTDKVLPLNYIVTYAKDKADCKTIYDVIYDSMLTAKKSDKYSLDVNAFGNQYKDSNITYNSKVYKSLWNGLDS